jgi:hypothetical protein
VAVKFNLSHLEMYIYKLKSRAVWVGVAGVANNTCACHL